MEWWNFLPILRKVNVILGYFPGASFCFSDMWKSIIWLLQGGGTSENIVNIYIYIFISYLVTIERERESGQKSSKRKNIHHSPVIKHHQRASRGHHNLYIHQESWNHQNQNHQKSERVSSKSSWNIWNAACRNIWSARYIIFYDTFLIVCSHLLKVQTSNSSRSQDFLRSHPLPAKPVLALSLRSSWRWKSHP